MIYYSNNILYIYILWFTFKRGTRAQLILGYEGYIWWVSIIKKLRYFIHINQNPMIPGPKKSVTSCGDRLAKTVQDSDKPVFESQN